MPTTSQEIAVLTEKGLIFLGAIFDSHTDTWSAEKVNENEILLGGQSNHLVVEYEEDKYILASVNHPNFFKVDRKK